MAGLDEVLARLLAATGAGVACVVDDAGALAAAGTAAGALDAAGIRRLAAGAAALATDCGALSVEPAAEAVHELVLGAPAGTHVLRALPGSDLLLYAFVPAGGDVGRARAQLGAARVRDDVRQALAAPPAPVHDTVTALVAAALGLPRPRTPADPGPGAREPALVTLGPARPARGPGRAAGRPVPAPRRPAIAPPPPPLPRRAPAAPAPAPRPTDAPAPPEPDRAWASDVETMRRVLAGLRRLT